MLPRPPSRRRRSLGPAALCAAATALILLIITLSVLYSLLSSSVFPSPTPDVEESLLLVADDSVDEASSSSSSSSITLASDDRIDELDVLEEDGSLAASGTPDRDAGLYLRWDHAVGVARLPFGGGASDRSLIAADLPPDVADVSSTMVFGSDDEPVDLGARARLAGIGDIEEALLLKPGKAKLREGWAAWLEGKADYLRRNQMLRTGLEQLHPKSHPLLQDPDGNGVFALTRGDRLVQRILLNDLLHAPPLAGDKRRALQSMVEEGKHEPVVKPEKAGSSRRWGYFPGIESHLPFSEFVDRFFGTEQCGVRVFMVWNSPQWMYGVRHQRGLESLLLHHRDACVLMLSETLELDFFKGFAKDGFKVAVAVPNLDELLKDTPASIFSTVWNEWRKTKYYPLHYSELVRLAALYKYGGIYLDSDIIVLKPLHLLRNTIGFEEHVGSNSSFGGAVLSFEKNSSFLLECLQEFYSTYDDTLVRWNGADLMTRVVSRLSNLTDKTGGNLDLKIEAPFAFYPISSSNITSYFAEPADKVEIDEQDALYNHIMNESMTFHLWNGITSSLVPETNSLVARLLSRYCLRCHDIV